MFRQTGKWSRSDFTLEALARAGLGIISQHSDWQERGFSSCFLTSLLSDQPPRPPQSKPSSVFASSACSSARPSWRARGWTAWSQRCSGRLGRGCLPLAPGTRICQQVLRENGSCLWRLAVKNVAITYFYLYFGQQFGYITYSLKAKDMFSYQHLN